MSTAILMNNTISVLPADWEQYELLDSGQGRKLERIGKYTVIRPEPKAWWKPALGTAKWGVADAILPEEGDKHWQLKKGMPTEWILPFEDLRLKVKLTTMSKHVGVFPEHAAMWRRLAETICGIKSNNQSEPVRVLNLFGYTGVATLVAAQAGAQVTHVDASKASLTWARENQELSKLSTKPIRWILDDALKFVKREGRRQQQYDVLILDPPAFGRGPSGQTWKIERNLIPLLEACREILSDKPLCVMLTTYTTDASALLLGNLLQDMQLPSSGRYETGELIVAPRTINKPLALSIYANWYGI